MRFREVVKNLLRKALQKRGFFMIKYPKRGVAMLVIVQTTGVSPIFSHSGGSHVMVKANTPTLCRLTTFIEYHIKTGQLSILAENVSELANQEALDAAKSIEEYLESLKPKADPVKPQPTKSKKST